MRMIAGFGRIAFAGSLNRNRARVIFFTGLLYFINLLNLSIIRLQVKFECNSSAKFNLSWHSKTCDEIIGKIIIVLLSLFVRCDSNGTVSA